MHNGHLCPFPEPFRDSTHEAPSPIFSPQAPDPLYSACCCYRFSSLRDMLASCNVCLFVYLIFILMFSIVFNHVCNMPFLLFFSMIYCINGQYV